VSARLAPQHGLVFHPGAVNFTFLSHGLDPRTRAAVRGYVAGNVINIPFPSWVHFARASPEYSAVPGGEEATQLLAPIPLQQGGKETPTEAGAVISNNAAVRGSGPPANGAAGGANGGAAAQQQQQGPAASAAQQQ
jgi:hypothetical protein